MELREAQGDIEVQRWKRKETQVSFYPPEEEKQAASQWRHNREMSGNKRMGYKNVRAVTATPLLLSRQLLSAAATTTEQKIAKVFVGKTIVSVCLHPVPQRAAAPQSA